MCGISALLGPSADSRRLAAMLQSQQHRGPDSNGMYLDPSGRAAIGHNRLSIIDLSPAGAQPLRSPDGRYVLAFNGEIYNYLELRVELSEHAFRTSSDSEVLLAAYQRWGAACLDRLIGMFAFLVWDTQQHSLFAARDRFGVKPLYYHEMGDGSVLLASELRAFRAAGVAMEPEITSWATYLSFGVHDHSARTFWRGIAALPAGHYLTWNARGLHIVRWYDLAQRVGNEFDERPAQLVEEEYRSLLAESVRFRFRADVPVGINLSGGLDSSALLGLVHQIQGATSDVMAFTFVTGDERYDELPWVRAMLAQTAHPLIECRLSPNEIPSLAESVSDHQSEPFGGIPTLAYAKLFAEVRSRGVVVVLDGQGMDEQWAGYDYFRASANSSAAPTIQGARDSAVRPECLAPEFRTLAQRPDFARPFADTLRNLQYRDLFYTKLPRALRFNDRTSMRASVELREPFLDHRLVELAMRQPYERKICGDTGKWLLRELVRSIIPQGVSHAPKRPLQTPQREWLRSSLAEWSSDLVEEGLDWAGSAWLDTNRVRREVAAFHAGAYDVSTFLWQWISVGLLARALRGKAPAHRVASSHSAAACEQSEHTLSL